MSIEIAAALDGTAAPAAYTEATSASPGPGVQASVTPNVGDGAAVPEFACVIHLIVAVVVLDPVVLDATERDDDVAGSPPSMDDACPPPQPTSNGTVAASNSVATRLIETARSLRNRLQTNDDACVASR